MKREYELTFVIRPDKDDEGFAAVTDKVAGYVKAAGGEVTSTNLWGRRRLAYPIRRFAEGYYVFMLIQMDANGLAELDRSLRLNEDIIRHLVVRKDE
ncbi:MAG: 30S ribosomal protein S6 [Anaerolineae bacterium]